jgi:ribose transport system substrate-binding protein
MKKTKFYVSLHTRDNDYQAAQAASAEEIARKLDIDVEIAYADNDAVTQSTQILKAIQSAPDSRPDAIILEPISKIALPQAARAACDAGMGWAVLNRAPEYLSELRARGTVPVFALSSDHAEIGRIQGRQFAALLPKGGSVLYLEGPSRSSAAQQRTEGMLETKPSNIQIAAIKGDWTELSAQRAVRSWLKLATSQSTTVGLVAAQDDSMAMGARKAFQEIGDRQERQRWLALPFTGCDGQPATGQAWVREGLLSSTIYIPPIAGQAMEILIAAIKGGTQPLEHVFTKSYSVPPLDVLAQRKQDA